MPAKLRVQDSFAPERRLGIVEYRYGRNRGRFPQDLANKLSVPSLLQVVGR
jgi:hypothetical protein